jgi:hypothetical protein
MKNLTRQLFLPLLLSLLCGATIFTSCKKNQEPQAPLVITKADYNNNYKPNGTAYRTFSVSASAINVPIAGENQTWDFSNLTETSSFANGGANFLTPNNTAFGGATYTYADSGTWEWCFKFYFYNYKLYRT